MKRKIRIGNAGGYWGDDLSALKRQLSGGSLDYITMDFLAEITMSILQRQRKQKPDLGYAVDFLTQLDECLPLIAKKGTRVISSAGGINPIGMARRIVKMAQKKGLEIKVGVVYGDDIVDQLYELSAAGERFTNMETGEDFFDVRSKITSANIYLGAEPVVKALDAGCHIVVTGRVTDTGITLAPMIHEFGWAMDDWDRMASGIVAAHLIECGCQVSGGNITDWQDVKSFHNIGYPIIEMENSGEFVVTKHARTGGLVSEKTVKEQLVYEMGDPSNYISPDGVARFDSIQLKQIGEDRVRVWGIKGKPEPDFLKVSMSYDDGWKSSGEVLVSGPGTREKAETIADIFWKKLNYKYEATRTEMIGSGSIWPDDLSAYESNEILLRFGVRDHDIDKVKEFGKQLSTLILSGPAGMAVTGQGRPKPKQVIAYWPALIHRSRVKAKVLTITSDGGEDFYEIQFPIRVQTRPDEAAVVAEDRPKKKKPAGRARSVRLQDIAYARSGDKGDTCNIGVLARSDAIYDWLVDYLTPERVRKFFTGITFGDVTRYELDNIRGLNFLLDQTLDGGGTRSLMIDPQGKTLAQALLQMPISLPSSLLPKSSRKSSSKSKTKSSKAKKATRARR
ncbi:acyclic terpene utilization AtuA family protein [candidate division GN15 bacterium]|nr:acyclic terpene utilization AtuA family protein [candidate division GN15 bacterium]